MVVVLGDVAISWRIGRIDNSTVWVLSFMKVPIVEV